MKSLSIRIDARLLDKLHIAADDEGRSACAQILYLIRKDIEKFEKTNGKIEIGWR